MQKNISNTY